MAFRCPESSRLPEAFHQHSPEMFFMSLYGQDLLGLMCPSSASFVHELVHLHTMLLILVD